jgi:hypothetical protein
MIYWPSRTTTPTPLTHYSTTQPAISTDIVYRQFLALEWTKTAFGRHSDMSFQFAGLVLAASDIYNLFMEPRNVLCTLVHKLEVRICFCTRDFRLLL